MRIGFSDAAPARPSSATHLPAPTLLTAPPGGRRPVVPPRSIGPPHDRFAHRILDDYQNVALTQGNWAALGEDAHTTVFTRHLPTLEAQAEASPRSTCCA